MKVFCQVLAVNPYTLVVSLPNQLLGHIPITQVSTQFTSLLEAADGSSDEDDEESPSSDIPDLRDMFEVGQYLRAVVTAVKPPGTSDTTFGHARDALEKSSRRIELSTVPEYVNEGMTKADLQPGVVSFANSPFLQFLMVFADDLRGSQRPGGSWIYNRTGNSRHHRVSIIQCYKGSWK